MAGFLDSKTRILDTILTQEGRMQLSYGKLKIEFASFSDASTYYKGDVLSGSEDLSNRLILEASSLDRDQITFETDDAGALIPYYGGELTLVNGKIMSGTTSTLRGAEFASLSSQVLLQSIDNYRNFMLLGSYDPFQDSNNFIPSITEVTFSVTDSTQTHTGKTEEKINNIESFFYDKRLAHLPNFQYLPPVNKISKSQLGSYGFSGQSAYTSYEQIKSDLSNAQVSTVTFAETSRQNNLVAQIFEVNNDSMIKLDIIDYGEFVYDGVNKRVFFAGKVYEDDVGTNTFVSIFTVIFNQA